MIKHYVLSKDEFTGQYRTACLLSPKIQNLQMEHGKEKRILLHSKKLGKHGMVINAYFTIICML